LILLEIMKLLPIFWFRDGKVSIKQRSLCRAPG